MPRTTTKESTIFGISRWRELQSVYDDLKDEFEGYPVEFEFGVTTVTTAMPWRLIRVWFRTAGVSLANCAIHIQKGP